MPEQRVTIDEAGRFELRVPDGWVAELDAEEGGVQLWDPEGAGLLHVLAIEQPPGELPDPADELYAFLEEQGIELEEDDVEDLELAGGLDLALCEYIAEDDEDPAEEPTFWMTAVAAAPGALLFATYSCDAGDESRERDAVRGVLRSVAPRREP